MLGYFYLDVNELILRKKIYDGYDRKRKTKIIDVRKLSRSLVKEISLMKTKKANGVIIDSHLSHYIPNKFVDRCLVTKCSIKELNNRLKRKKFGSTKIKENLEAEIFDVCHTEALEKGHKVTIVDTSKGFNINSIARKIGVKC